MSAIGMLENVLLSLLKGTDEADILRPPPNSLFLLHTAVVLVTTEAILQPSGKGQENYEFVPTFVSH